MQRNRDHMDVGRVTHSAPHSATTPAVGDSSEAQRDTLEHRSGQRRNGRPPFGQRGGALVEAALVSAFLYAPLLIGLVVVGLSTINRIQLDQLVRDVGIMHARGMDFSSTSGYDLFIKLTQGSPFRENGDTLKYNGTMIISTIRYVTDLECGNCSNANQPVITHRVVLGNAALHGSRFGTPSSVDTQGRVQDWKNDASARAPNILNFVIGMQPGDEAYVAEGYMLTPGISFPEVNAQSESASWAIF